MAAVQKRFYVALDIKRPTANRDFEVVEGDNGNVLEIELTDDGAAVDLSGCRVLAIFSKSNGAAQQDTDGHGVEVDAEQTNRLTIALYATSVAPGLVECELQVYSGEEYATLATSAKFNFMCRRGIANDDVVQATEEWPLLVDTLQRCEAVEDAEAKRVLVEGARTEQEEARQMAEDAREEYADKWRNMSLAVSKLDFSEQPTATITEEETRFSVSLGIPQGEPGSVTSHVHGNITNDGRIGITPNLPVFTGEGGVLETKSATQARTAISAYEIPLRFNNTVVDTSDWSADTTYSDFGYCKVVALTGVLSTMIPEVIFAPADAMGGNFAPVAASYDGGIYLYAAAVPSSSITIPTITLWKAVS